MTVFRLFRQVLSLEADSELLGRFISTRDELAFAELLRRHGPLVYRVCRRLLDPASADDAFQATFLVLATRAAHVRQAASLGSWLIGVAGRIARQMRRRQSRFTEPLTEPVGLVPQPDFGELGGILDEELTRLPEKLRVVAVECLVKEKTQADAAAELGESERTVRRRVSEARQLLRERLTRRGVVPAVSVGLVASLNGTARAVPTILADKTMLVVFDFLAGGVAVSSAPAVLANGVAMNGLRLKLAASVAVLAIGLTVVGIGLADDPPKLSPLAVPPKATTSTIPPQKLPGASELLTAPPTVKVHAEPLFTVLGGDELVNRLVLREAEYQAQLLAMKWTGKPLPPLPEKWRIAVKIEPGKVSGATTFTFNSDQPQPSLRTSETHLSGSLEELLRITLPHEITHCVLAAHFGRPVPRWADEGIAVLSESLVEQVQHDRKFREFCNAGRAIQLKHLLPMKEYPRDMSVLFAQGNSVVRFLYEKDAKKLLPLIEASFTDGWDKALKANYGFQDADELEAAWLEWLKKPTSVMKAVAKTTAPDLNPYRIEAPDVLLIQFEPKLDGLPKTENYLVRPDGTINLGQYGSAKVAGLTLAEAAAEVRNAIGQNLGHVKVVLDVAEYKSKFYTLVIGFADGRDAVEQYAITGETTVLDILKQLDSHPNAKEIRESVNISIARPGQKGEEDQILPVDWVGITKHGQTRTNYQLLPGDRVFVKPKK